MSLYWQQLKAMYLKDWLIRKRHWIVTITELLMPIFLVWTHCNNTQEPLSMSNGTLPGLSDVPPSEDMPSPSFSTENPNLRKLICPEGPECPVLYYEEEFTCIANFYIVFFYTLPNTTSFSIPSLPSFRITAHYVPNEYELLKAWGHNATSLAFHQWNYAVTFHELDLDNGIFNYTIGKGYFPNAERWTVEPFGHYTNKELAKLQSYINIFLALYDSVQDMAATSFEYVITTRLFKDGNPKTDLSESISTSNIQVNNTGSPVEAMSFYTSYIYLEIGFLYLSTIIARRVVQEKVTNSKELLRIMGLSDLIYWVSHFINYLSLSIFHATAITFVYSYSRKNPYNGWNGSVFWFNYIMNSVTNILFTFALSTMLNRPIVGVLIVIVSRAALAYLPSWAKTLSFNTLWISPKAWSCLLPSGQLFYSIYDYIYFGMISKQVTWSNLFDAIHIEDTISFFTIYLVTIISWFLYFVLIWYLDAVWPWQPGIPKPWYFPVSKFIKRSAKNDESDESSLAFNPNHNRANQEREPDNLKPSIQCINLYKSFGPITAKKFAVDGLNVNILRGQITALLGHNGAGKTTLMSMITGILRPTSGKILIDGIDVHRDVVAARRLLSLCPQTDLLFEELTVAENLNLCTGLRGLCGQEKKDMVPLNIKRVNLTDKVNTLASNLSGGMRRRLQLALALSTASEILVLDEPTSGLDPESRRQLWDLLLELRKDRTILLTTHFMEEADALGDRIIIMSSGKVKCSGSSMYLKRRFGAGNSIRLAKDPSFTPNRLSNQILSHFPNAVITNETNTEIIYQLTVESQKSADESIKSLIALCDTLDTDLSSMGITSYGIAVTTLEDVFLKVSEDEKEPIKPIQMEDKLFELNRILDYVKLNGLSLTLQRIRGLVMKRFHYTRRHSKTIAFTLFIPVLVILFTFYAVGDTLDFIHYLLAIKERSFPLALDVKAIYGENAKAVILASSSANQPFVQAYRTIMNESGIGVVEIPGDVKMVDYMKTSTQNPDQFMTENIFGIIEDPRTWTGYSIWVNPFAPLSFPLGINAWTNALTRIRDPDWSSSSWLSSKITTNYALMPNRELAAPFSISLAVTVVVALFSPIAFCLISCSYFIFPSIEAQNKANLIQKMSGINTPIFWLSHFIFDFFLHIIVSIFIVVSIVLTDNLLFVESNIFAAVVLLLVLYGAASIPLFYLLSMIPIKPDRGFALLACISIVATLISSGLASLLTSFEQPLVDYAIFGHLFPPFSMSFGLAKIFRLALIRTECERFFGCNPGNFQIKLICCDENMNPVTANPFEAKYGINTEIIMLLLDTILYSTLLIIVDFNLHRLAHLYEATTKKLYALSASVRSRIEIEDDDVAVERVRIKRLVDSGDYSTSSEALVVYELSKYFGSLIAVDKLSFGVHKAECFGLLGVNGAGKTTTFRMLTGDLMVSRGDAFVGPYSLKKNMLAFQKSVSYCPQFDALIENLTPQETLTLFARIRGMPEDKVKANVEYIIKSTDLTRFAKTRNQNLSGGNKRKLSLAIAAIAKSQVMFLDEPTTGVDPASRRKIWSTLIYLREKTRASIVLSSHSMDECEALCSRIGIMARGSFKCLGPTQHLKQKFGQGFTLVIKVNQEALRRDIEVERIKHFIQEKFPSSILKDSHQTLLHYHVTDTSSRWGDMLRSLNQGKASLPIEDFTLSDTSLEQIFISFAKEK